ncbi:MAG: zeta toxin family protein [Clostridia bacterium]|nr:zeta toxin family protein [Clostridia bacterium]
MPSYYIIAGCNGAGKSTLYKSAPIPHNITNINVDQILYNELKIKNQPYTQNSFFNFKQAGKLALTRIDNYILNKTSFCQETTLNGHRIKTNIVKAHNNNFKIIMFYVGLDSVETAISRIKKRTQIGGHYINENDVRRRYQNMSACFEGIIDYIDIIVFYDNSNKLNLFAIYEKEYGLNKVSEAPNWFYQFETYFR